MTDTLNVTTSPGQALAERVRDARQGIALGAVRIVASFLFGCHGLQGLFGAFGGVDGKGTAVPFGAWPGWWGSVIELGGAALVLVGLLVRPAAVLCSGAMAYAYFTVHQPIEVLPLQNMGELAALYSWVFLLIAILGPGSFTLDAVLRNRRADQPTT